MYIYYYFSLDIKDEELLCGYALINSLKLLQQAMVLFFIIIFVIIQHQTAQRSFSSYRIKFEPHCRTDPLVDLKVCNVYILTVQVFK